ncbi:MAG: ATP-binding cassette domain-containing protein [Thermoplasmataceae archaeon]
MSTVEIREISKKLGKYKFVKIDGLKFQSPVIHGLLGPNGAGKSTILKLISGCVSTFEGSILINDIDIKEHREKATRRMGSLIENPKFYPYVSGFQLLKFVAEIRMGKGKEVSLEVHKVLELVGLLEKSENMIQTYSTGELKRLSLAVAVIGDPPIIILDEPSDNLDIFGDAVLDNIINIDSLGDDKIIIIASHDIKLLEKFCTDVTIMIEGEISETIKLSGLDDRKIIQLNRDFIEDNPLNVKCDIDGKSITIDSSSYRILPKLLQDLIDYGYEIKSVTSESTLEKKYLELIKKFKN